MISERWKTYKLSPKIAQVTAWESFWAAADWRNPKELSGLPKLRKRNVVRSHGAKEHTREVDRELQISSEDPSQVSADHWSVQKCKKTTWCQGKDCPKQYSSKFSTREVLPLRIHLTISWDVVVIIYGEGATTIK